MGFIYRFEWDPAKARANLAKHGVSFGLAATVFHDPLSATIPDPDHSEQEDRWVTLGQAANGAHMLVVHTWEDAEPKSATVRIISARKTTKAEIHDYEEGLA